MTRSPTCSCLSAHHASTPACKLTLLLARQRSLSACSLPRSPAISLYPSPASHLSVYCSPVPLADCLACPPPVIPLSPLAHCLARSLSRAPAVCRLSRSPTVLLADCLTRPLTCCLAISLSHAMSRSKNHNFKSIHVTVIIPTPAQPLIHGSSCTRPLACALIYSASRPPTHLHDRPCDCPHVHTPTALWTRLLARRPKSVYERTKIRATRVMISKQVYAGRVQIISLGIRLYRDRSQFCHLPICRCHPPSRRGHGIARPSQNG